MTSTRCGRRVPCLGALPPPRKQKYCWLYQPSQHQAISYEINSNNKRTETQKTGTLPDEPATTHPRTRNTSIFTKKTSRPPRLTNNQGTNLKEHRAPTNTSPARKTNTQTNKTQTPTPPEYTPQKRQSQETRRPDTKSNRPKHTNQKNNQRTSTRQNKTRSPHIFTL